MTGFAHSIDAPYDVRTFRLLLPGWWRRQNTDDRRRTLARYEEQAEAHRQAAMLGQKVGSETAYAHQMEVQAWYEREAEKLRRKVARREQKGSPS